MSVRSKRRRMYDGDEARQIFDALYFSEQATDSDLLLRLSSSSDSDEYELSSDSHDDEQRCESKSSENSPMENEVEIAVLGENMQGRHCSHYKFPTNEEEHLTECHHSRIEDRPVSDQDWNEEEDVLLSGTGGKRPGSEVDWNDMEGTTEKRPVSEVDWNDTDGVQHSRSGEERPVSEVDWNNTDGIDDVSVGEAICRAVSEVDWSINEITAPRGRKRQRVHYADEDSDSSVCSDVQIQSYARARKQNKESLELSAILRLKCCRNFCLHKVSRSEVFKCRTAFQTKTKAEQRQWILQHLYEHHEKSGSMVTYMFNIGTTHLCQRGWRLALGIKRTRMWQVQHDFENGLVRYTSANSHRIGLQSTKVLNTIAWLRRFADRIGEKLPTSEKIHLPSCLTRASVYNTMKQEIGGSSGETICSQVHFFRIWRKEMSHISIPKVNRFSKCDVCTTLKAEIEKTTDKIARQTLFQQREIHLTQQKTERLKYYKHNQKAKREPHKYLSVIIDGMDQKATSIPRFCRESKSTSSAWKLPSHITGSIVQGRGAHLFVDIKDYPHDSNLTSNILLNILKKYSSSIPDTLYLQMDNCGRENKNQCIIGLCALLVELNVFKKVKIGFLMKGHTHEDVDQLFSRISVFTCRQNIPTLSSLIATIPHGYNKPNTTAERISTIYNIRDWLHTEAELISNHSFPHQFKITKNEHGKAVLHTKKWSSSPEWQCSTGEEYILRRHPEGPPNIVKPQTANLGLTRLEQDINDKYRPYLTQEQYDEWSDLLKSLKGNDDDDHNAPWTLTDILMGKDDQPSMSCPANEVNLQLLNDEQTPILPVHIGRKQRPEKAPPKMKVGSMIGVYLREYRHEWPQVGKVTTIDEESITVHWFSGTATSAWVPLFQNGEVGQEPYIQIIDSMNIITCPFDLTRSSKLPQEVQRQLKEKEEEIYAS